MFKPIILSAIAVSVLSLSAGAQSFYVPDNVPTGGCNVIPFGNSGLSTTWANQRYQTMATAADLGNAVVLNICDLAFAPCGTSSFIRHFDSIEVKLGQTSATTLSATFAANMVTNVQTVLDCKNFDWHQTGGQWNRLGLEKNYLYLAPQGSTLVVQITVTGAQHVAGTGGSAGCATGARQRIWNYNWTPPNAPTTGTLGSGSALKWEVVVEQEDLHEFGIGCAGSNGTPELDLSGSARVGQSLNIDLRNGPKPGATFLAIALSQICGGFDLGIIGAPGCAQFVPTTVLLGVPTSATGTARVIVPVPNDPRLVALRAYVQFFPLDRINSAGLTASNYGRILVGR